MTAELPEHVARMRLSGRADDSQFAQNPEPVVISMAFSLAALHRDSDTELERRTDAELAHALAHVDGPEPLPAPFDQVSRHVVRAQLELTAWQGRSVVTTHGAPIVSACTLVDSVAAFDDLGTNGSDPAERDLAIALRSVAATFGAEASRPFLEAYEEAGGSEYELAVLDWYALLAAFR